MIVRCSHCKEILDDANSEEHQCDMPLNGVQKIKVVYFQDGSYGNKEIMTALGIDGVLYSLEVIPRQAIPLMQPYPTKFHNKDKPTETSQHHIKTCGYEMS